MEKRSPVNKGIELFHQIMSIEIMESFPCMWLLRCGKIILSGRESAIYGFSAKHKESILL